MPPRPAPIFSWCESMWRNFLGLVDVGDGARKLLCTSLPVTAHTLYLLRPSSNPRISRGFGAMKSSHVATSACTAST